MTWSYTPGSTDKDAVRLYIGDTVSTDPQLTDEEVAIYLAAYPDPIMAASAACMALAARYARQVDKSLGQLSISASQRSKAYVELSAELKSRALLADGLTMSVGGITVAEHVDAARDTDATQPAYQRGQHDYPGNAGEGGGPFDPRWQ